MIYSRYGGTLMYRFRYYNKWKNGDLDHLEANYSLYIIWKDNAQNILIHIPIVLCICGLIVPCQTVKKKVEDRLIIKTASLRGFIGCIGLHSNICLVKC